MRISTALFAAAALLAFVLSPPALPAENPPEDAVRLGFVTDIHFDVPSNGHKYGGVEVDTGPSNHQIPVNARKALDAVSPDIILDTGDLTAHSGFEEFRAYAEWMNDLPAPVYAVMGNHDRQHHDLSHPYGTGFYSECGFTSATRTLKMGNMVFILLSEDHKWEDHPLTAAISTQRFDWLEKQLQKYATDDNNVFILEHYPLRRTTAWTDFWYGMDRDRWPTWTEITREWKSLMYEYDDSIVAHVSGHLHTHYKWRDTPWDRQLQYYGDAVNGVENVGHFVNGSAINRQDREFAPFHLPDAYFLNMQALAYTHGGPWRSYKQVRPLLSAAVFYGDVRPDALEFTLLTHDIQQQRVVDSYTIRLDHPAELGDGKLHFMESDLGIRRKDDTIQITQYDWFHVPAGEKGTAIFQKRWKKPVDISGLKVMASGGSHDSVEWKGSPDTGESWTDWSDKPPGGADVVQVRIRFKAGAGPMKVHDVRLKTAKE